MEVLFDDIAISELYPPQNDHISRNPNNNHYQIEDMYCQKVRQEGLFCYFSVKKHKSMTWDF